MNIQTAPHHTTYHWVMIMGISRESRHWGDFVHTLADSFPGGKILALDIPGTGKKHQELSPYRIKDYIPKLRKEFLKARNLLNDDKPWCIMGLSMGGMISLEWMSQFPEDFTKGFVINSSAANLSNPLNRLTPNGLKSCARIMTSKCLNSQEKAVLELVSSKPENKEHKIEEWAEIFESAPISAANSARQFLACSLFQAPKKIKNPLVFLNGARDEMVSPKCTQSLSDFYDAPLYKCVHSGHDVILDHPEWVVHKVKKCL